MFPWSFLSLKYKQVNTDTTVALENKATKKVSCIINYVYFMTSSPIGILFILGMFLSLLNAGGVQFYLLFYSVFLKTTDYTEDVFDVIKAVKTKRPEGLSSSPASWVVRADRPETWWY